MNTRVTKIAQIKKHFESGKSLSHLEAIGLYGTHRLSAYVLTLKRMYRMNIQTEMKQTLQGTPYARYHFTKEETNG